MQILQQEDADVPEQPGVQVHDVHGDSDQERGAARHEHLSALG